jgi:aldehyde dehydrogenase (NAD+)
MSNNGYEYLKKIINKGSGKELNDVDPSTGNTIIKLETMTIREVDNAVNNSCDSFEKWSKTNPVKRGLILTKAGEIMEKETEEIAQLMTLEEGKTLRDSRLEVIRSFNTLKFYGSIAQKYGGSSIPSGTENTTIITLKEPVGVAALISPWNFPLSIPVWKIAPALAAGNTVILKPASNTPLIAIKLLEILTRAGLPNNVAQIVLGSGKDIGNSLIKNNSISLVSFTGSVPTGKNIYKNVGTKNTMTRIQLELGGKNAFYVDRSAKIDFAADLSVRGAFGLTGQSCTATSRLIIHESVYEDLKSAILNRMRSWKTGPGIDDKSDMGPVVDENQLEIDMEYIEIGINDKLKLLYGGNTTKKGDLFLEPVIFDGVTQDSKLFTDEIFGPVLALTSVKNEDEAIELVNSVNYGHTSGIVTDSFESAMKFVNGVETGVVKVNRPTVGLELQAPFGAFKQSGANTWKEMGEEAMEFYTREKTVYMGW